MKRNGKFEAQYGCFLDLWVKFDYNGLFFKIHLRNVLGECVSAAQGKNRRLKEHVTLRASGKFYHLSKLLFSCFPQFKRNSVHDQNNLNT